MTTLEKIRKKAENDARIHGYYLTPDEELLQDLLEGLLKNEERYGYASCPCRLASGKLEFDRDIICPCDYRDPDVEQHGFCYCALYVRKDVHEGKTPIESIPERRPMEKHMRAYAVSSETPKDRTQVTIKKSEKPSIIQLKLYYCRQCGYLCFREDPPYVCPICKARKEIFVELKVKTEILEKS